MDDGGDEDGGDVDIDVVDGPCIDGSYQQIMHITPSLREHRVPSPPSMRLHRLLDPQTRHQSLNDEDVEDAKTWLAKVKGHQSQTSHVTL